ncbi:MAG: hypothetical protein J6C86_01790 [Bacteroidaceae bacterium]|nr:hypothetical protein [Bacteroidaceae bacterium]
MSPYSPSVRYNDYRTNIKHTLKQNLLTESRLDDFVACYKPDDRYY